MLKNEKGITLIILVITIIIMIILISVGITYGTYSASEIQLQNFSYELQQIQGKVDIIHEKINLEGNEQYFMLDNIELGDDITLYPEAVEVLTKVTGINYDTTSNNELYPNGDSHTAYRYFSKKALQEQLNIKNPKFSVIINFKTREVLSVEPHKYNDRNIYRLQDI